jgi:hypothetical protein
MENLIEIETEVILITETKFRVVISGYDLWVTAQDNGKHFGSIRRAGTRSWLDAHTGDFASQADAVKYLLTAIAREVSAAAATGVFIMDGDVNLPGDFHTAGEIMDAAFKDYSVYQALQQINGLITDVKNWKSPVRISYQDFPVQWIEATTGFFSGCVSGAGLYWIGERDSLYCEGYYVRIGA